MNQSELIHAGWTNCDPKGLLLYNVAEFVVRDSILLEEEIKEFEYTHRSYDRGPSLSAKRTTRIEVQKKAASKKERN